MVVLSLFSLGDVGPKEPKAVSGSSSMKLWEWLQPVRSRQSRNVMPAAEEVPDEGAISNSPAPEAYSICRSCAIS
jgi:hypothetical protein